MRKKKVYIILGSVLCVFMGMLGFSCAREGISDFFIEDFFEQTGESQNVSPEKNNQQNSNNVSQKEKHEGDFVQASIIHASGKTLKRRIRVPNGYKRTKCKPDSIGVFLRNYPMKKDGSPVRLYNGSKKGNQNAHVAVFKLPIEAEDLQQCADSVMRVYAEYFWKTGQEERIKFHFVDGFLADYISWRDGGRIQVGSTTSWVNSAAYDASYQNFKKYLRMVFAYAGTLSMEAESRRIDIGRLRIGDVFIKGDSPGHVVMVVDICKKADGKKAFLLAQGYMPAQEFHLLKNPRHEEDPWYYEEEVTYPFETPEYIFEEGSLRRLEY